jgi:DNA modification methylase
MKDYGHPAMFPTELAYRALKMFSFQNDVILDPFNGAGTTTFVAEKTGRRYLGIDLSADYCATAEKRIKNDTLKDFSAVLNAKLELEGKHLSVKERGEIPNHKKVKVPKVKKEKPISPLFTEI